MAASFYDNFVVAKDGSVESLCSYQARINKPKKTRSKGPALVFAFTEEEQQNLEQQKLEQEKSSLLEYKKSAMAKAFSKIATFSYLKNMRVSGGTTAENSGSNRIMSNSSTVPDSTAVRAHSFPWRQ
ncbi:hypothetical protein O6H91_06G018200 [Diphasiastrum complanatum]|uniref:Uncharacterized protein n=1 Tax=Diphasiastrum complanatum TaxID=34168 RepID=A0ACC2DBC1_DIPCM|nr:hypothetical protein O6H91_06G018200 [Diphasiastrum complanatum]